MSRLPRIPRAPAAASGIKPVTTPGTPVSVTAPTAPAAGPPSPAKTDPVPANKATPPEWRREETKKILMARIKIKRKVQQFSSSALPVTIGKLTENKKISLSNYKTETQAVPLR